MSTLGLILFAFFVGTSSAIPIDIGIGLPSDISNYGIGLPSDPYLNNYQSLSGSDLWKLLSLNGNAYPENYMGSVGVDGSEWLSSVSINNYPSVVRRPVKAFKESFVRDYGYGSREYGVRNEVSVASNVPGIASPYNRICSYFPVGTCVRGINRYPIQPVNYDVVAL